MKDNILYKEIEKLLANKEIIEVLPKNKGLTADKLCLLIEDVGCGFADWYYLTAKKYIQFEGFEAKNPELMKDGKLKPTKELFQYFIKTVYQNKQ